MRVILGIKVQGLANATSGVDEETVQNRMMFSILPYNYYLSVNKCTMQEKMRAKQSCLYNPSRSHEHDPKSKMTSGQQNNSSRLNISSNKAPPELQTLQWHSQEPRLKPVHHVNSVTCSKQATLLSATYKWS